MNRYHAALNSLDEMKTFMLADQISAVQKEIYIGCKSLNWNSLGMLLTESKMSKSNYALLCSVTVPAQIQIEFKYVNMCLVLGISDFIGQSLQTVSKFESVVKHIQKYERDIDSILHSIATAKLLKLPQQPDRADDLPGTLTCNIIKLLRYYPSFLFTFHLLDFVTFLSDQKVL